MKDLKRWLQDNGACYDGRKFVGALTDGELAKLRLDTQIECTIENTVNTIERGDWLLWLGQKLKLELKPMTLAKARCAKTVIHLMKDQRSINAVMVAEKFGLTDEVSLDDLRSAAAAAAAAYTDAAYTAAAAAYAAATAAYAAAYAYAAATTATAADARIKNQKQTADICREVLGKLIIEKWYSL